MKSRTLKMETKGRLTVDYVLNRDNFSASDRLHLAVMKVRKGIVAIK